MPKLKLSTFVPIPEGDYVFKIRDVEYKSEFHKVSLYLVAHTGKKHTENFFFQKKDETPNEVALSIFSNIARTLLGDRDTDELDPEELKGYSFKARVEHDVVPKKDGSGNFTYVRLKDIEKVELDEEEEEVESPAPGDEEVEVEEVDDDLDALLGD